MKKDKTLFRTNQIIQYIFYVVAGVLTLRFVLKLLGANAGAAFTDFVYALSAVFVAPFQYVFGVAEVAGGVIEWNALLAIAVYWLLAEVLIMMVSGLRSVGDNEVRQSLREDY